MRSTVTVLDPAADIALISLATAKVALQIKPSDRRKDDALKLYIKWASARCNNFCRRTLVAERVSELFEFDGCEDSDNLVLKRFPVVSITSVVEGDDDPLVVDTAYRVDKQQGMIFRLSSGQPSSWYWRRRSGFLSGTVEVIYTAGFEAGAVDPDVERACLQLVKAYDAGSNRDPSVRSVNIPDVEAVTYADAEPLPPDVEQALKRFRRAL